MPTEKSPGAWQVTAWWGNDDACSHLVVSDAVWREIQSGGACSLRSVAHYEGSAFDVQWNFSGSYVTVESDDGEVCLDEFPVADLHRSPA